MKILKSKKRKMSKDASLRTPYKVKRKSENYKETIKEKSFSKIRHSLTFSFLITYNLIVRFLLIKFHV